MSEAVWGWRPLYEQLLELVAETRLESWPFQQFPPGWRERVETVLEQLDAALEEDIACHFPERATSSLRRLADALREPERLSGREVGMVRRILLDSEARHGEVGGPDRRARMAKRQVEEDPAARFEAARRLLCQRLGELDLESGVADLDALLSWDGGSFPHSLAQRARQAWLAPLPRLIEGQVVTTLTHLSQIAPRLVAGVMRDGTASGNDLADAYQAHRARIGSAPFETVTAGSHPASDAARGALREMVELWWRHFPEAEPESRLRMDWDILLWLSGSDLRLTTPAAELELARRTADQAAGTLYSRYYSLPERPSCEDELRRTVWQRARSRDPLASEVQPAQAAEEMRLLTSAGLWPLWVELRPAVNPVPSAERCLDFIARELRQPCPRKYQHWQRHKRVAYAWQRLLFFLSLAEPDERRDFLARENESAQLARWLADAGQEKPEAAAVLTGWCNGATPSS